MRKLKPFEYSYAGYQRVAIDLRSLAFAVKMSLRSAVMIMHFRGKNTDRFPGNGQGERSTQDVPVRTRTTSTQMNKSYFGCFLGDDNDCFSVSLKLSNTRLKSDADSSSYFEYESTLSSHVRQAGRASKAALPSG